MTQEPIEATFVELATTAVAVAPEHGGAVQAPTWSREQLNLLKGTLAAGTTDMEFELFINVARRMGLDPFTRQIFAVPRGSGDRRQLTIQTSIDGLRLLAQRSGKLRGQRGPWWCGNDGEWREVWLEDSPPQAAKVEVIHADYPDPVAAVARWGAFVQTNQGGGPNAMWSRMGDHMLAKCAEALALRRAFPAELSGIYTDDEMGQADNEAAPARRDAPAQRELPAPPAAREAPAQRPPAGAPPARAPRPQPVAEGPNQALGRELKEALDARGLTLAHVEEFLGTAPTVANIRAWLAGEEGRTLAMLVADVASLTAHAEREAAAEAGAPDAGEDVDEDAPIV